MTFCTIVEFEWDEDFDHEGFRRTLGRLSAESPSPTGLLSRITSIDARGAPGRPRYPSSPATIPETSTATPAGTLGPDRRYSRRRDVRAGRFPRAIPPGPP